MIWEACAGAWYQYRDLHLGRKQAGGEAIAPVEIDGGMDAETLQELRGLKQVVRADFPVSANLPKSGIEADQALALAVAAFLACSAAFEVSGCSQSDHHQPQENQ